MPRYQICQFMHTQAQKLHWIASWKNSSRTNKGGVCVHICPHECMPVHTSSDQACSTWSTHNVQQQALLLLCRCQYPYSALGSMSSCTMQISTWISKCLYMVKSLIGLQITILWLSFMLYFSLLFVAVRLVSVHVRHCNCSFVSSGRHFECSVFQVLLTIPHICPF